MKTLEDRPFRFWPEALSLRSMRGRIALLLGLAMLPAGAIAMQVGFNAASARQAAYQETLSRRAIESIASERRTIDELREMLRVLATTPSLQQIEAGDCRDWLSEISARYPYIAAISVTSDDGQLYCSVPASTVARVPDSDIRRRARARDAFTMGYTEHGVLSGLPVLAALEPIRDGDRRIGFVGASIATTELMALLERSRNANNSLANAHAAIVDSHGRVIAESAPDVSAPPLPAAEEVTRRFGGEPVFIKVRGGDAVIVPLYAPDLYAVMSWAPERPLWQRVGGVAFSIAAPLLIWLLAIGAGWLAIEVFVARPLSSLEAAARGYARGEDVGDSPALLSAPSEIRSLRRTLAAMAKTLRGRELRLVEALAEERALLREVHHRVKNNLQMVASLLNIQSRAASDESESWGLARAHDRVQLLAVVHQRIYSSGELRDVRVDDIRAVERSYGDADVTSDITLPTASDALYQDLLPVYNPTASTIAAGSVLISSNVAANTGAYVQVAPATIDQTNVIGVAAEAIAATSKGFMVPRGGKFALALTTGTIARGDVLVTSNTVSGSGYLGVDNTPTTGADVGVALRPSSDGNLLLILLR